MVADDARTSIALFRYRVIAPLLDPSLDEAERRRIRQEILAREHPCPEPGGTRRVSGRTLRRWLAAYRKGGFEGLKPKPRSDAQNPRAIPPEIVDLAVRLKEQVPERSVRQIIELMVQDPSVPVREGDIKPSTLARHLRRLGKTRELLKAPSGVFRRYEKAERNLQWQADVKYGPWLPDPRDGTKKLRTYLICFMDDHSRLICHGEFYFTQDLPALLDCFKKAVLKRGIPARVYCDNGAIFTSNQFEVILAELGSRHVAGQPYAPQARGKLERFFRTVEESFFPELRLVEVNTLDELNRLFWAWLEQSYHHHVNRETGQTPAARFSKGPGEIRMLDPMRVREIFLWRAKRRVDSTCTFTFQGNRYEVDPRLARRVIEIRYDPFDLSEISVWWQGQCFGYAIPHLLQRQYDRAVTLPPTPENPRPALPPVSFLKVLEEKHREELKARIGRISFARSEEGM